MHANFPLSLMHRGKSLNSMRGQARNCPYFERHKGANMRKERRKRGDCKIRKERMNRKRKPILVCKYHSPIQLVASMKIDIYSCLVFAARSFYCFFPRNWERNKISSIHFFFLRTEIRIWDKGRFSRPFIGAQRPLNGQFRRSTNDNPTPHKWP